MKTKLLQTLFIYLVFCGVTEAQTIFPDQNDHQKWEYVTWNFWGGWCQTNIIKTGDEVALCDELFIEVFDCDENEENCYLFGYYRIQNDSVLVRQKSIYYTGNEWRDTVYCDDPEGLMYDFGLELDDAVECLLSSPTATTDCVKTGESLIDYEGTERATHYINFSPYPSMPSIIFTTKWIDGIGATIHPFYSLTCIGDHCEWEQQLTRVYKNDELIYLDTVLTFTFPCTNVSTYTVEHKKNTLTDLQLFPNPVQSDLWIQSGPTIALPLKARMFNAVGVPVCSYLLNETESSIQTGHLIPGIYFLELSNEEGRRLEKIIKI